MMKAISEPGTGGDQSCRDTGNGMAKGFEVGGELREFLREMMYARLAVPENAP
jgi:hypothetical protein